MAVLIASSLRKEFSGDPLFQGVSFTVGRRDRLSLAGPNGAGKTTLLRAIAGETSLQGGELAFAKGTRVSPRSTPAARARPHAARVCPVRRPGSPRARRRAPPARAAHGGGSTRRGHATALRRRSGAARACGRLGLARACRSCRPRARVRRRRSRSTARDVLRRRADPGLAGPCARRRA